MKLSKNLAATEEEKCVRLSTDNIISASIAQSQPVSVVSEALQQPRQVSALETSCTEDSPELFEVSVRRVAPSISVDRTPLPFEEIPGPAILKLWEKYWKYVPLLGTQLFCSLLINRFTQGRLTWNRNVTPIQYLFNEYGCIVRINGPLAGDIVMIHRPEHIAEVFKQEGETPVRSGIDILQHYRLHHRKYRIAGPFSLQGSEWLELREKVDEPFSQIISNSFAKLEMVCDEMVNRIRRMRNRQDEVSANFHQDLIRWGMECFCTLVFGKRLGFLDSTSLEIESETNRIINALITAHTYLNRCETGFQVWRFFETPFSKRLFTACDILDEFIGKYVRQAQSKLMTKPLSTYEDACANEGPVVLRNLLVNQRIHPDDIATLLMDMIMLGVQATINCQAFLMYYLARNPRVQKKVFDEIMSVSPNKGYSLTAEDVRNMPYLKACLQESLRLRPAFPYITRLLSKTISLHGYTIPKGTFIIMASQITSRREENFEDPEKFKPERWLPNQSHEEGCQEYSYLPFGHGVRSCLGKNMAEFQMMLLTAKIIREYRIEYDYADIGSKFLMVNVPNKPLRFRFVDRG
ncbi:hypothetical protein KM043_018417 [Ampulex compressa]|nr:hypothetical protein KM043_018417 [Ampulex compressa]